MLNYVALIGTSYLVTGPMKDADAAYPQSARLVREAWMPRIIPETRLHLGILVALALAVALYVFNNPVGAIFSGGLFALLRSGSELLQINAQVPQVLVQVVQGIVILLVVAFGVLRARAWFFR